MLAKFKNGSIPTFQFSKIAISKTIHTRVMTSQLITKRNTIAWESTRCLKHLRGFEEIRLSSWIPKAQNSYGLILKPCSSWWDTTQMCLCIDRCLYNNLSIVLAFHGNASSARYNGIIVLLIKAFRHKNLGERKNKLFHSKILFDI